jgi:hypothetical protein
MKTHNTNQETPGTPLEAFDTIYMNLARGFVAELLSQGQMTGLCTET